MTNEPHQILTATLAATGPLALIVYGLVPAAWLNRQGIRAARIGAHLAVMVLLTSVLSVASLMLNGTADVRLQVAGPFYLGVYFDNWTALVLVLISFLLTVVARYSINYLAGEPAQGRFTKWLCLTGGSVLGIVISGNLVQFAVAWCATSLCLHQLLLFYPQRPGAVLAARKKFIVSRLGDACLLAAILLAYELFHTWNFAALFEAAKQWQTTGSSAHALGLNALCFVLVAGAMLKSAQFPFHSWLPDTMETPTPVSALMHAGIINAGGFLIIRLNPLVTLSPAAMSTLALFGAFTALFASLVMLTHASVKRALAFSTVAQMGFMMLECGLGAFGLAALHLVAHSLYKAHAFLASGNIVSMAKSAWTPKEKPSAQPLMLLTAFAVAVGFSLLGSWLFRLDYSHEPALFVLGGTFTMALAYTLWNLWSQSPNLKLAVGGSIFAGAIATVYFSLHKIFGQLLVQDAWSNALLNSWPGAALIATLLGLFLLVLVIQTELPVWANRPFFQACYVHARNGFYFNTLANRLVSTVWPVKPSPPR